MHNTDYVAVVEDHPELLVLSAVHLGNPVLNLADLESEPHASIHTEGPILLEALGFTPPLECPSKGPPFPALTTASLTQLSYLFAWARLFPGRLDHVRAQARKEAYATTTWGVTLLTDLIGIPVVENHAYPPDRPAFRHPYRKLVNQLKNVPIKDVGLRQAILRDSYAAACPRDTVPGD